MKGRDNLIDYLKKTALLERPLYGGRIEDFDIAVVIPAYAEEEHLFQTLNSLGENPRDELKKTLVLCVINHEERACPSVRENNARTIERIRDMIKGPSEINLGYIDASSPGLEIPDKEKGVGTARKIGMDRAVRLLFPLVGERGVIACLDADTTVKPNYLSALREGFKDVYWGACVIDYEHPLPPDEHLAKGICNYEIFLRYYVLGLTIANSPYAYPVMGSAMAVTVGTYLKTRGMNRRAAGEDFYFLNKIAKITPIKRLRTTQVFPAARVSTRVPFGTGKSLEKTRHFNELFEKVYHPESFFILALWLKAVEEAFFCQKGDVDNLMEMAREIHPFLAEFLQERKFPTSWARIYGQTRQPYQLIRRFHEWFDAFETLKFIRALHRQVYPMVEITCALRTLLTDYPSWCPSFTDEISALDTRQKILNFLRTL